MDIKSMPLNDLRLFANRIEAEIRHRRTQHALKILARLQDKSFTIRRREADLSDALQSRLCYKIDDALDDLEPLLEVV